MAMHNDSLALAAPMDEARLTPRERIHLEYFEAPAELKPFITTLFHFRCDDEDIRDVQPASWAQFNVYVSGDGVMHFPDGRDDPSHVVSLIAPTRQATGFSVVGPFETIGAALSPLGWIALTGLDAFEHGNMVHDGVGLFGPDAERLRAAIVAGRAAGIAPAELALKVAEFIGSRLGRVNPRHARMVGEVIEWLGSSFDPPVEELLARLAYSERQAQRLVQRYFGAPPRQLARRYRAIRVAVLLHEPDLPDDQLAELLNLFYDQSHLIREIRHYAGRTPARLTDKQKPILDTLLDRRNFRMIRGNPLEKAFD